ncbi:NAD(P)H-hydrate dehydratase [Alloscardovia omnicolens]|uniref:ADP-dependent NAD(P)H-hydrate dehydratase n=1 Tax=Alloscardovia omnicolens TaxID=419015 RepID=UPI003A64515B
MQLTVEHLAGLFPEPLASDSKYTRGIVGLITGSDEYPGAGVLSTCAAASCGAGYVRYSGPDRVVQTLLGLHPEVVFSASPDHRVDAWVLGSGYGGLYGANDVRGTQIRHILSHLDQAYAVVDAGALESFATMELTPQQRSHCVITPHMGEAARLYTVLGERVYADQLANNPEYAAAYMARQLGCTVVLKGAQTVVACADGTSFVCPPATHRLATAGTGDVLAGLMGGMLALHAQMIQAGEVELARVAAAAVCVHSYAAGLAAHDTEEMDEWLGRTRRSAHSHALNVLQMTEQIPAAIAVMSR